MKVKEPECPSMQDGKDGAMDALWVKEAEARLDAYDRGELKAIPLAEVLAKYGKGQCAPSERN